MPKALTYTGIAVAGLIILVFGLDLAIGVPFSKAVPVFDIMMLVSATLLAYLSWNTLREQA